MTVKNWLLLFIAVVCTVLMLFLIIEEFKLLKEWIEED